MSKTGTTRVTIKPGEPLPRGNTDWERVRAMTDEEVMAAALSDPDAQPLTPEQLARMRRVPRVKLLRQQLGMTQAEFGDSTPCRVDHSPGRRRASAQGFQNSLASSRRRFYRRRISRYTEQPHHVQAPPTSAGNWIGTP